MNRTFVSVNDSVLVAAIQRATRRLVFIAPGLRPAVALALRDAMKVVPVEAIHLVLDVDAEVARLGYGDKNFKGMGLLQAAAAEHGVTVNHHPGIRIGLLIADDVTLIYSPTPELIETENRQPDKPNAILLNAELPVSLANACAVGAEGHATLEVGKDVIDTRDVETVKRDLVERPPKEFNVARVERVFSSMLHFVELRIEDYKLTSRSLSLNPELFGVKKAEVARRLSNRYHLFAETEALTVEIEVTGPDGKLVKKRFGPRSIDEERQRIKDRFIIEAGDLGLLILRKDVEEFERELKLLEARMEAYKQAVQKEIKRRTEEIVDELLAALKDALKANPPDHWKKQFATTTPTDADIRRLFEKEVRAEVNRVNTDFKPRVFYAFKDVTYQTFHDKKFRKLLEDHFGEMEIHRIFKEYDAAPEQKQAESSDS